MLSSMNLGLWARPQRKMPLDGEIQGPELQVGLHEEAVGVEGQLEELGDLLGRLVRPDGRGEHQVVGGKFQGRP